MKKTSKMGSTPGVRVEAKGQAASPRPVRKTARRSTRGSSKR